MKCPKCERYRENNEPISILGNSLKCNSCNVYSERTEWITENDSVNNFRPKHYEKGHDTFAWAEHKFDLETNIAICQFNIHKYNDREKGQTIEDFEKIIAYAKRALDLIKEDKMEVTFDEQS